MPSAIFQYDLAWSQCCCRAGEEIKHIVCRQVDATKDPEVEAHEDFRAARFA